MKNKYVRIVAILILAGGLSGGAYYIGNKNNKKTADKAVTVKTVKPTENTPPKTTTDGKTTTPAATKPSGMVADISKFEPAGLFAASQSRQLTNFTAWTDSPVSVEYRDFNDDGVNDSFVSAKLPGTMGYSIAAVWTTGADNKPKELWYLPSDQYVAQSSWTVNSTNTLVNSGKQDNSGTITTKINNWHWQVSTTGSGFVLEPDI